MTERLGQDLSGQALLFRYLRPWRGRFALACLFLLLGSALQLVFPYVIGILVDSTLLPESAAKSAWINDINRVALVLLGIVALIIVCVFLDTCLFAEVGERALADLRIDCYSRLIMLPMSYFAHHRVGEMTSRLLSDLSVIQEFWIHDLRMLVRYGALALGGVLMLFMTEIRLALVVALVAPLVVLFAFIFGRGIRAYSSTAQDRLAESSVVVEETLQAVQSVKSFGNERYEVGRYRHLLQEFLQPAIHGARIRALFVCSIVFIILTTVVSIMWYGSRLIQTGEISVGQFTRFMFYLAFAGSAGGTLAELFSRLQKTRGAQNRTVEILRETTEVLPLNPSLSNSVRSAGVAFRDVSFSYPSRDSVTVIRNLSFTADPGQRLAIVGPSGAGKSTLVSLIFRFFDPDRGVIEINGQPIHTFSLPELRQQMALVPQEVLLFGANVAENIAYGRPGATREEIIEAARRAHAHDFIEALPQGYQTLLGERGTGLSGGQRQRIAIARAILKDAPLLILDEATSALDSDSEQQVQQALDDLMAERTTLIIAHRLSTVRNADRILVLSNGELVETGSHEELYQLDGTYRLLCEQQLLISER